MSPQEAKEKLEALVQARVAPLLADLQRQLTKAKQALLGWFYAGYDAGMKDDPTSTDVEGLRKLTLEQRKVKAAAKHTIETRKAEGLPPIPQPKKVTNAAKKKSSKLQGKAKATKK